MSRADVYREKAEQHRAKGNLRLAKEYEKQAAEYEMLAEHRAREVNRTITVRGRRYKVSLNYNDKGLWYANAHGPGDMFPAAYISDQPTEAACLEAVRAYLKER
jgi:hypothetical protein